MDITRIWRYLPIQHKQKKEGTAIFCLRSITIWLPPCWAKPEWMRANFCVGQHWWFPYLLFLQNKNGKKHSEISKPYRVHFSWVGNFKGVIMPVEGLGNYSLHLKRHKFVHLGCLKNAKFLLLPFFNIPNPIWSRFFFKLSFFEMKSPSQLSVCKHSKFVWI